MKRQESNTVNNVVNNNEKTIKRLGETNVNWLTCINEW